MNMLGNSNILGTLTRSISKRSPEILTGIGVSGMIATVIMAVKATPKAIKQIDEDVYKRQDINSLSAPGKIIITCSAFKMIFHNTQIYF